MNMKSNSVRTITPKHSTIQTQEYDTGDIVLLSRNCSDLAFPGRLMCISGKFLQNCHWDHVGVVIRGRDETLYFVDVTLAGVKAYPLVERLERSRAKITCVRRLYTRRDSDFRKKSYEYLDSIMGLPYHSNVYDHVRLTVMRAFNEDVLLRRLHSLRSDFQSIKLIKQSNQSNVKNPKNSIPSLVNDVQSLYDAHVSLYPDYFAKKPLVDHNPYPSLYCTELILALYEKLGLTYSYPAVGDYVPIDMSTQFSPSRLLLSPQACIGQDVTVRNDYTKGSSSLTDVVVGESLVIDLQQLTNDYETDFEMTVFSREVEVEIGLVHDQYDDVDVKLSEDDKSIVFYSAGKYHANHHQHHHHHQHHVVNISKLFHSFATDAYNVRHKPKYVRITGLGHDDDEEDGDGLARSTCAINFSLAERIEQQKLDTAMKENDVILCDELNGELNAGNVLDLMKRAGKRFELKQGDVLSENCLYIIEDGLITVSNTSESGRYNDLLSFFFFFSSSSSSMKLSSRGQTYLPPNAFNNSNLHQAQVTSPNATVVSIPLDDVMSEMICQNGLTSKVVLLPVQERADRLKTRLRKQHDDDDEVKLK